MKKTFLITKGKEKHGGMEKKINRIGQAVMTLLYAGVLLLSTARLSVAYNNDIFQVFDNIFGDLTSDFIEIATPIAAFLIVVCLFCIMFIKNNDKAVGAAWTWLKRIVIGYVGIICITTIIDTIADYAGKINEENGNDTLN